MTFYLSPRFILLKLLLASLIFGSSINVALEIKGFEPKESVVYKSINGKDLKLHIFYPENHSASDQRSAIIFFFGGGWKSGSASQFYPQCDYLAKRGMVAISADYRVESRDGTTPRECVKDAKSAMRWLRVNAARLGIDPEKILAGGASAGGHIAAATALLDDFNEEGEDLSISSRPVALVLFNPVYDNGPDGYGYERVEKYWEMISPMEHIDEDTPPAVVFLGTKDNFIPVSTAKKFKEMMEGQGVRSDLHLYDGEKHGFFNFNRGKMYSETVSKMDQFLVSLGFLEPQCEEEKIAGASFE